MKDQQTKLKILQTARSLFAKNGFSATSFREIAKDADISFSSITYHYKTKEGLLGEILKELQESVDFDIFYILEKEIKNKVDFKFQLSLFLNSVLIFGYKNWECIKIVTTESFKLDTENGIGNFSTLYLNKLTSFFKKAKKKNILSKTTSCHQLADIFMALLIDQILYFKVKSKMGEIDISKPNQREMWTSSTIDLLCNGAF